jgi:hypothetical protein
MLGTEISITRILGYTAYRVDVGRSGVTLIIKIFKGCDILQNGLLIYALVVAMAMYTNAHNECLVAIVFKKKLSFWQVDFRNIENRGNRMAKSSHMAHLT